MWNFINCVKKNAVVLVDLVEGIINEIEVDKCDN